EDGDGPVGVVHGCETYHSLSASWPGSPRPALRQVEPKMPNRLLLAAAELPFVRRLIVANAFTRPVVERFVAGETLDDGIRAARDLEAQGTLAILDYLGEMVGSEEQAEAAAGLYLEALRRIGAEGIDVHVAVKLTQLGLDL